MKFFIPAENDDLAEILILVYSFQKLLAFITTWNKDYA